MAKQTVEYFVVVHTMEDRFIAEVNEQLRLGWELYGNLCMAETGYAQALVWRRLEKE
jgi:hypothetical protein